MKIIQYEAIVFALSICTLGETMVTNLVLPFSVGSRGGFGTLVSQPRLHLQPSFFALCHMQDCSLLELASLGVLGQMYGSPPLEPYLG